MGQVPGLVESWVLTSPDGLLKGVVCLRKSLALELTHSHHLLEDCINVFHLPWHISPITCVWCPSGKTSPKTPFLSLLDQGGKQGGHPGRTVSVPIY